MALLHPELRYLLTTSDVRLKCTQCSHRERLPYSVFCMREDACGNICRICLRDRLIPGVPMKPEMWVQCS